MYFSSFFTNEMMEKKCKNTGLFFFNSYADRVRSYNPVVVLSPFLYIQFYWQQYLDTEDTDSLIIMWNLTFFTYSVYGCITSVCTVIMPT